MVTLHEAIEHAREVSRRGCTECHKEHGQLADWLEELERRREEENCPRVHAWWVYRGFEKGWECSNCHSRCLLNYEGDFQTSTFCPHCGAQMDGTEETT